MLNFMMAIYDLDESIKPGNDRPTVLQGKFIPAVTVLTPAKLSLAHVGAKCRSHCERGRFDEPGKVLHEICVAIS